jgi:DNA-binding LacI/PurR family transcriptional regulator
MIQHKRELGHRAAKVLIDIIEGYDIGGELDKNTFLKTELVIRGSTRYLNNKVSVSNL